MKLEEALDDLVEQTAARKLMASRVQIRQAIVVKVGMWAITRYAEEADR